MSMALLIVHRSLLIPFFILPDKPIVNTRAYEATTNLNVELKTAIDPATPLSYTTYFGTFPATNQLRRSVNLFINALRPRPYKPYLHYNSWMDIGFFTTYSEQDVLRRMDEWNKEFITGRGVTLDAFLLDDGWDDRTGRWLFGPAFSRGFSKVREKKQPACKVQWGCGFHHGVVIISPEISASLTPKSMVLKRLMANSPYPGDTISITSINRLLS